MKEGGSAYLPKRLATPLIADGTLFELADVPVFKRPVYLLVNDTTTQAWTWLDAAMQDAKGRIGLTLSGNGAKIQ